MQLSIVSTLYYSEPYLDEFLRRMSASAQQITQDYELVLVNDGSPDQSLQKALAAQTQDSRIRIIDLSRNFGHHEAGMAGLEQARGNYVFLIDCDLEEAPELLNDFWQTLQQQPEYDVIYGIQTQRKGGWFEQHSGQLFYTLFNALSEIKIAPNVLTVRLMKKQFVDCITLYPERTLFVGGIMAHAGFNQHAVVVKKHSKATTTYTLSKQLKLFVTSITAFSTKPLLYLFIVGCGILSFAALSLLAIGLKTLIFNSDISTALAILLATSIITGCLMTCTGLLGLYIANIQTETKQRPRTITKRIY